MKQVCKSHLRIAHQSTGNRNTLPLPPTQASAVFTHGRGVALGQGAHEVVSVGKFGTPESMTRTKVCIQEEINVNLRMKTKSDRIQMSGYKISSMFEDAQQNMLYEPLHVIHRPRSFWQTIGNVFSDRDGKQLRFLGHPRNGARKFLGRILS